MAQDMPGGKGEVVVYDNPQEGVERVRDPDWFGFAEVNIQIPKSLWGKFEEMPPFSYNKQIPEQAVPSHMKAYRDRTGRTQSKSQKLVGALSAEKMLVYVPLLRWYLDHGAELLAVYRTIDYKKASMQWFVDEVTEARQAGDADKTKALLADVFKLLGNSCYGKMIENVASHNSTRYTKDEKLVDRMLHSAYFKDLNEIGSAYELTSRKRSVAINRPYQIGIAVYQLAKQRMLEFHYDFLDKYMDRRDYELIQMDTDSSYMALSAPTLDDLVKPHKKAEYEREKKRWLAWDKHSGRTPGLFKLECDGDGMIALCSKCYFALSRRCTATQTGRKTAASAWWPGG